MSDNKVSELEDAVVSEMIKQLPQEKIYIITKCFQELEDCETGFLTKNQTRNQRKE